MNRCPNCGGNKQNAPCLYPRECKWMPPVVKPRLSQGMLPCTLAELGWTMLLGIVTFSVLTLAIHGAYYTITFFWGIFL